MSATAPLAPVKDKNVSGEGGLFELGLHERTQPGEAAPQVGDPAAIQICVPAGSVIMRAGTPG